MTTSPETNTFEEHWLDVFLHGFIEHIGHFTHVFPHWQKNGINIFAFDQRGFGLTAEDVDGLYGKTAGEHQVEDAEWAVGEAKARFGDGLPVFIMVLDFATRTKHQLAGVIASAPLILQTSAAPKIARYIGGKVSQILPNTIIPANVNPVAE